MKEKVVIIGGKGTAVVIAEQIYDAQIRFGKEIEVIGFAFDDPAFLGGINGWPVLCGTKEAYEKFKDDADIKFVFAMYRSDLLKERIQLRDNLNIPKERYLSFIHPTAYVAKSVRIQSSRGRAWAQFCPGSHQAASTCQRHSHPKDHSGRPHQ